MNPAAQSPSDPAALREPSPALVAHFRDPALRARLVGNLRWHKVPERRVEDIVQTTMADLWSKRHAWPEANEELERLLFAALHCDRIDAGRSDARSPLLRKDRAADGDADGADRDADREDPQPVAVSTSPIEARDDLRWAGQYVEQRPGLRKAFDWLMQMQKGVKAAEIGAREGSSENTVTVAVSRLREQLRAAYRALVALVLVGLLGWAYIDKHGINDTAKPDPRPAPTVVAPEGPAPAPTQAPEPSAGELRARAFDACDARQWESCYADLSRAASLDPGGDADPRVQAARKSAIRGMSAK